MKKLGYLALLCCTIITCFQTKAQLPNQGFELWDSSTVVNGTKIYNPVNWFSSNYSLVDIGFEQTVTYTTDAHTGNYALQLIGKSDDNDLQSTYITSGNDIGESPADPLASKFRLEGRINGFEGYYKFMPNGIDSFRVFLALYRNGQYLGQSYFYISTPTTTYTRFFWPVNYPGTVTPPDSAKFIIEPSTIDGANGSVLILDDIGVTYGFTSGMNEEEQAPAFELYPNPASTFLKLQSSVVLNYETYKIYNAQGAMLASGQLSNGMVDVANLPSGLYTLVVATSTGSVSSKKWIKK